MYHHITVFSKKDINVLVTFSIALIFVALICIISTKKMNNFDTVVFGTYEQDNDTTNGNEDIEWIVLKTKGNRTLILSRYGLDCRSFNDEIVDVSWEDSSIRAWLNGDFLNAAFTTEEQERLDSEIFLLSSTDVCLYLNGSSELVCEPTSYASAKGGTGWWWLSSAGEFDHYAAGVFDSGAIDTSGYPVHSEMTVRPAVWITTPTLDSRQVAENFK